MKFIKINFINNDYCTIFEIIGNYIKDEIYTRYNYLSLETTQEILDSIMPNIKEMFSSMIELKDKLNYFTSKEKYEKAEVIYQSFERKEYINKLLERTTIELIDIDLEDIDNEDMSILYIPIEDYRIKVFAI